MFSTWILEQEEEEDSESPLRAVAGLSGRTQGGQRAEMEGRELGWWGDLKQWQFTQDRSGMRSLPKDCVVLA